MSEDEQSRLEGFIQEGSIPEKTISEEGLKALFNKTVEELKPEVYGLMKRALELGKWPNGDELTDKQKEICMETIVRYDHANLPEEQRIGYIEKKKRDSGSDNEEASPIRFSEDDTSPPSPKSH